MKTIAGMILIVVVLTGAVAAESLDKEFFVRQHQAREAARQARDEALAGLDWTRFTASRDQEEFDVQYYELDLNLDPDSESITGTVTIRARSLTASLSQAAFDLFNDMTVTDISGDMAAYTHEADLITVELDRSYTQGEFFEISIAYTGQPQEYQQLGFHFRTAAGAPAMSNDSYPYFARSWWPCKDDPADKADSVDMLITVPAELTVVCNGALRSVTDNPGMTRTFHWHEGYPICTYLIAIGAAAYETFSDTYHAAGGETMEITNFVFPADLNDAMEDLNITIGAMDLYASLFGEYPFLEEKYGLAECATAFAGMEYQTITFYGSPYLTGDHTYDYIIVHELAHMWWGDMVTNENWHHTWLNEGFATYCEALYYEHLDGPEAYRLYMLESIPAVGYTDPIYRDDTTDPFGILAGEVYDKGAWVLHMLRGVVEDEVFFDILAEYRDQYEFSTVTTEDFQAVCEQVWGQDLDWFFQQWIYEPWHPEYYWGWQVSDGPGGTYLIEGFIDQVQEDGPVFTMPVELGVVTAAEETLYYPIFCDEASELFSILSDDEPVALLLDPLDWILKEEQSVSEPSVNYTYHHISGDGNGDGRPDPGESVSLSIELTNSGVNASQLTVTLSTDDPDIIITNPMIVYGDVSHGSGIENTGDPFAFEVGSSAQTHLARLDLTFSSPGGYTGEERFYLTIGAPSVLLVDDDGGDDYEQIYQEALAVHNAPFHSWRHSIEGSPADTLDDFDVVIWFTGRERTGTLDQDEQTGLAAYLDSGGKLFLCGQDIGYDLVDQGNGEAFFNDYLYADYVTDISPEGFLQGVSGDPITGSVNLITVGPDFESPDVISPREGADVTLKYSPSGAAAGIKYGGDYRLVYLTVGLEGLNKLVGESEGLRTTIMGNTLNWLQFVASKGDVNEDGQVNIIDVVWVVNIILGVTTPNQSQEWASDYNEDGQVNILDAISIVNIILGPAGLKSTAGPETSGLLIPVEIEAEGHLAGVQIELGYDSRNSTFFEPHLEGGQNNVKLSSAVTEDEITILLYNLTENSITTDGQVTIEIPAAGTDLLGMRKSVWIQDHILTGINGERLSGSVSLAFSKGNAELPGGFELHQNFPNPFNPETEIRFAIPAGIGDQSVALSVYNTLGQLVRTLVHGQKDAGYYTVRWDGLNNEGRPVASGLYYYVLKADQFKSMKRMMLVK